jgi:hypothetical protein
MTDHDPNCIEAKVIYGSVRQEILDQKRCQFEIFAAALTLSTTVLAYGVSRVTAQPIVYAAPIIMNVMTLTILMSKAISIQRMVGYLQLMESRDTPRHGWMWEYHLNLFREKEGVKDGEDELDKHQYACTVSAMLLALNLMFLVLYFSGPEAVPFRAYLNYPMRWLWFISVPIIVLNLFGFYFAGKRMWQLAYGTMTSNAVRKRWNEVFAAADEELDKLQNDGPKKPSTSVPVVDDRPAVGLPPSPPR